MMPDGDTTAHLRKQVGGLFLRQAAWRAFAAGLYCADAVVWGVRHEGNAIGRPNLAVGPARSGKCRGTRSGLWGGAGIGDSRSTRFRSRARAPDRRTARQKFRGSE